MYFIGSHDQPSREAGKKQYLIPYFIAAHPGCEDEDMVNLARWLKKNEFKVDQVQTFYPSPMSLATAMYHSDKNPLKKVTYKSEKLYTPKNTEQRKVQKALLRYHDPENWPLLRQVLPKMGHSDLIGERDSCLIPEEEKNTNSNRRKSNKKPEIKSKAASKHRATGSRRQDSKSGNSFAKPGKKRVGGKPGGKKQRMKSMKPR